MRAFTQDELTEPLLAEWAELFAADPLATPFSSPAWARTWWRHWGAGARPLVVGARDGERLVALAPLVVRRTGPFRIARPLGDNLADYWDVIACDELRALATRAVADELMRRRGEWDVLVLKHLPPGSQTPAVLGAAGLALRPQAEYPYPAIELPATFEDYLRTLPTDRRTNLRRRLRPLDDGELSLRRVEDPASLPAAVERWQNMRIAQWQAGGKDLYPLHATERFRAFFQDLAVELAPAGSCLLWELDRGDELVGSYVNFADGRAFYSYLGGFAPGAARLGIGKLITAHGIRTSIAAGRRCYDFLEGGEAYKYWYGAVDRFSAFSLGTNGRLASRLGSALGRALNRLH